MVKCIDLPVDTTESILMLHASWSGNFMDLWLNFLLQVLWESTSFVPAQDMNMHRHINETENRMWVSDDPFLVRDGVIAYRISATHFGWTGQKR